MIYATYNGKNKEYRTEFATFAAGKKQSITPSQYQILKHVKGFEFQGKGIDKKLEKVKQEAKEQRKKDIENLQKHKKDIAKKTEKAVKASGDSKMNLRKLKDAQRRLKKLTGK